MKRPRDIALACGIAAVLGLGPAGAGLAASPVSGSYSVVEYRVTGNSAFFDGFEDGRLDVTPTSYFTPIGATVVSEAYGPGGIGRPDFEGQLVFTAGDGYEPISFPLGGPGDLVFLGQPLVDGDGSATVDATFSVDFPPPGLAELYGLGIGESDTYLPTSAILVVRTGDAVDNLPPQCAVPNAIVVQFFNPAFELACDVLDFQAITGALVLRFSVDDVTDTALPAYSIDGGVMFFPVGGWDVPASAGAVWAYESSPFIFSSVFAAYEVPAPSHSAGSAAALLALAGVARRRAR